MVKSGIIITAFVLILTAAAAGQELKVNIVFSGSNNGYYRDCG
ncbi:MAG: hypothetical protein PHF33_02755 [Candidatus Delongbacteria bacterium]|jgi:hypothetical protein|nr:hypothetical protein [Candidatus Delongbacteria bacterium]MDD4204585.1 hypothetical protein [Candidatus Delongbacteria bacterium]MDY0017790.1 hypothetical protein [Candidatus Delongbacteria bacterium]